MKNTVNNIIGKLQHHRPEMVLAILALAVVGIAIGSGQSTVYVCGAIALSVIALAGTMVRILRRSTVSPTTDEDNGIISETADSPHVQNKEGTGKADNGEADNNVPECLRLIYADLEAMHCDPQFEDDGLLVFRYQGGYFNASAIDPGMVRILFPRIYSVGVTRQDFLCRVINRINTSYAVCKLIATPCAASPVVEVHALADIYYSAEMSDRDFRLRGVLSVFFSQQRTLAVSAAVEEIETPEPASDAPDECESSYKDISLN